MNRYTLLLVFKNKRNDSILQYYITLHTSSLMSHLSNPEGLMNKIAFKVQFTQLWCLLVRLSIQGVYGLVWMKFQELKGFIKSHLILNVILYELNLKREHWILQWYKGQIWIRIPRNIMKIMETTTFFIIGFHFILQCKKIINAWFCN